MDSVDGGADARRSAVLWLALEEERASMKLVIRSSEGGGDWRLEYIMLWIVLWSEEGSQKTWCSERGGVVRVGLRVVGYVCQLVRIEEFWPFSREASLPSHGL